MGGPASLVAGDVIVSVDGYDVDGIYDIPAVPAVRKVRGGRARRGRPGRPWLRTGQRGHDKGGDSGSGRAPRRLLSLCEDRTGI